MIFIDDKERERLTIAVTAGLAIHIIAFILFGYISLSPEPTVRYEKTILVELEDSTVARPRVQTPVVEPKVQEQPVQEPVVQEKQAEPEKAVPVKPEPVPEKPVQKTAVAKVEPVKPPAAVKKNQTTAPAKSSAPAKAAAPVKNPSDEATPATAQAADAPRLVPDPSAEPDRIKPVQNTVIPRQTGVQSTLPKPDIDLPDWARQSGAESTSSTERTIASSPGVNTSAPVTGSAGNGSPGMDLSKLDAAIETGVRNQAAGSTVPAQKVGAPPARTSSTAAGTGSQSNRPSSVSPIVNTIEWKDPTEGRTIQFKVEPKMPEWVQREGLNFDVIVSLDVIAEGTVSHAGIVKSSGYPEIDAIITDALRRWRFMPVQSGKTAHGNLPLTIRTSVR